MTTVTPEDMTADQLRKALAWKYRELGTQLLLAAERLETSTVFGLAAGKTPVPRLHSGARALEEALDAALVAL